MMRAHAAYYSNTIRYLEKASKKAGLSEVDKVKACSFLEAVVLQLDAIPKAASLCLSVIEPRPQYEGRTFKNGFDEDLYVSPIRINLQIKRIYEACTRTDLTNPKETLLALMRNTVEGDRNFLGLREELAHLEHAIEQVYATRDVEAAKR